MRKDMKKVLCESPRTHSSNGYHDVRRRLNRGDPEDLPDHQSMRKPYRHYYDHKRSTDYIMPLYRFLWSCVGRSYDDVWSEICATAPSNNTIDWHLRFHAKREVSINTCVIDGEIYEYARFGVRLVDGLYVDPRDGIIRSTIPDRDHMYVQKKQKYVSYHGESFIQDENGVLHSHRHPIKPLGYLTEAIKIDGIWYKVTIDQVPPAHLVTYVDHGETKTKKVSESRQSAVYGHTVWSGTWYYASKHQMSSHDLRKHKLINDQ